MGRSTNSNIYFLCSNDETLWAAPFIEEKQYVTGAGSWELNDISVPIRHCKVKDKGRLIYMSSDFYGLINPAKMDLPVSIQAIIYASSSIQDEDQDPIYAVLAKNIRSHNFGDLNPILRPGWFNYRKKYKSLLDAMYRLDESLPDIEIFGKKYYEDIVEALLNKQKEDYILDLIQQVLSIDGLEAPFTDRPGSERVLGYLSNVDPSSDFIQDVKANGLGYGSDGCPQYPDWEYTNKEIILLLNNFPDITVGLPPSFKDLLDPVLNAERDRIAGCAPSIKAKNRDNYIKAYLAAIDGAEDMIGAVSAINLYALPPDSDAKLKGYILQRIESPSSPVGNKLIAATTGNEVYRLISGIFEKGKWRDFEIKEKNAKKDLLTLVDSLKAANPKLDTFDLVDLTDYTSVLELADEWYSLVYGDQSIPSKILALDAYLMDAPVYMDNDLQAEIIDWYKQEVLEPVHMNDFFSNAGMSFYDVIKGAALALKLTGDINSSQHKDLWRKAATEYWTIGKLPKPFTRNQALSALAKYIANVAEAIEIGNITPIIDKMKSKTSTLTSEQLEKTDACILGAMEVSSSWRDDLNGMKAAITAGYTKADIKEDTYIEVQEILDGTYDVYIDDLDFELSSKNITHAIDHFISAPFDITTREYWACFLRMEDILKEDRLPFGYIAKYFQETDAATKTAFLEHCADFDYVLNDDVLAALKDVLVPAMEANPKKWEWLDWLGEGVLSSEAEPDDLVISLSGKRVCVTGKLSLKRKEIEQLLEANGAVIASGVSKTTDILIAGEDAGSKLSKANELGIMVLTEEEAKKLIGLQ